MVAITLLHEDVAILGGGAEHLTPAIGTRFSSNVQLSHVVDNDEQAAALARLISERGVLFFRGQDITLAQQKELCIRLGKHSGRPKESGLHIHPISEDAPELGGKDTSVISSKGGIAIAGYVAGTRASDGWHSDISFEKVPSDFTFLKMHTLPEVGGDTLWASGYAAYDKLSPHLAKFLEGLTAEHDGNFFHETARKQGLKIQPLRGHPLNVGEDLRASHPVIRTHPLTGHRTLFINKSFTKRINELSVAESDAIIDLLTRHISENHDIQVRWRWQKDDVAIWCNRSTFHTATHDYNNAPREGFRVVGVGEIPYFDPASKGRAETEALRAAKAI
ncbi:taurine catabolism dioxygenase [Auriculariales sp. MPI-PUGE-AT-0066]|nr:taurine catabolism dioxygenase [Auriculariales sp. MPI-PUGE-AT-0066]